MNVAFSKTPNTQIHIPIFNNPNEKYIYLKFEIGILWILFLGFWDFCQISFTFAHRSIKESDQLII